MYMYIGAVGAVFTFMALSCAAFNSFSLSFGFCKTINFWLEIKSLEKPEDKAIEISDNIILTTRISSLNDFGCLTNKASPIFTSTKNKVSLPYTVLPEVKIRPVPSLRLNGVGCDDDEEEDEAFVLVCFLASESSEVLSRFLFLLFFFFLVFLREIPPFSTRDIAVYLLPMSKASQ